MKRFLALLLALALVVCVAYPAMAQPATELVPMWVEYIDVGKHGKHMGIEVLVLSENGPMKRLPVTVEVLDESGVHFWGFTELTNRKGVADDTYRHVPAGTYRIIVRRIDRSGYYWDTEQGVTEVAFTRS